MVHTHSWNFGGTGVDVIRSVLQQMTVRRVVVDPVYLAKRNVVRKSKVSAIVQVHTIQHGYIIVVGAVDQKTAAKARRNADLSVFKGGPIVCDS